MWGVEPADWPAGDLLGEDSTKLIPTFELADLSTPERNIRAHLQEMGDVGDENRADQ